MRHLHILVFTGEGLILAAPPPSPSPRKSARRKAGPEPAGSTSDPADNATPSSLSESASDEAGPEPTESIRAPPEEAQRTTFVSADSRDRFGPRRRPVATETVEDSAAQAAERNRADPDFDPIAAAHSASLQIREILDFKWGSGRPFVSENVAAVLGSAVAYARAESADSVASRVMPRHLWRAIMARAFMSEPSGFAKNLASVDADTGIFSRILDSENGEADSAAAANPPQVEPGDLLHWESVEILARASGLRRETNMAYQDLGQRHLVIALFTTKLGQTALRDMGGLVSGHEAFKKALIAACRPESFAELGDDQEAWARILAALDAAPPLVDRIERRPDYLNDRVRVARPGQAQQEPLGAAEDARALADLMLLGAAEPPIAIGLFGPWGSGKSTLIEHLKSEIHRQTRAERAVRQGSAPRDEETRIVGNVVQLSFNAWTFADSTNLWATLTSEIFDQLAAGGWTESTEVEGEERESDPQTRAAAAALVSEVAARTAREVASLRVASVTVQEKDLAIKAARDVLDRKQQEKRASFGLAVADAARDLRGGEALQGDEDLKQLVVWSFGRRWRWALAAAVGFALLGWLAWWRLPPLAPLFPALVPLLSGVGTAIALLWPAISTLTSVARHWSERKEAADRAIAQAAADVRERTVALTAAEQQRDRSQGFLEAYRMDQGGSSAAAPMKMLDYLLHESETVAAIRAQTGLLATVRRCFEQLQTVIANARLRKEPDAIERIILYIDDLDRCSTRQVSDILQAVHLLLSFDCFVVIVAADANWLKQSLQKEHPQLFRRGTGQLTPADYLEKIFQIPFWVKPLVDVDAKEDKRFRLYEGYVDHLLRDEDTRAPVPPPPPPQVAAARGDGTAATDSSGSFTALKPTSAEEPAVPRRERIRLSQPEKDVLKRLGPLAAKSPRAVKRMINIYRLIRVRIEGPALEAFLGAGNDEVPAFKAVLFALACEVGLPASTMAVVGKALSGLSPTSWSYMRGKENDKGLSVRLAAADGVQPLGALQTAGRVDDFLLALAVVDDVIDPRQIHMGLEEVRRYSFHPL